MSKELKISFAGTPELAATILQKLIEANLYEIISVYTQPDRPAGRGRQVLKSAVKELAESNQLTLKQPANSVEIDPDNELSKVDVLIVAAYGMLLPESILNRPRLGCINIHTSLLPRWRGAAPIQRAIQHGDRETGITIMQMDAGLDTGQILRQEKCAIVSDETSATLHDKLAILGADSLHTLLREIAIKPVQGVAQNNRLASYAKKVSKKEAEIDWTLPAVVIERTIRAFNPKPICKTVLNDLQIRIWDATVIKTECKNNVPGTVLYCSREGIGVATGDQILAIRKLQLPGKKIITAVDFQNGHPNFITDG